MSDAAGISRILTLVFTDLADSTALKTQRGDRSEPRFTALLKKVGGGAVNLMKR